MVWTIKLPASEPILCLRPVYGNRTSLYMLAGGQ